MTRDDLARLALLEVDRQWEAARSRPRPPAWRCWALQEYENDLEYGPRYSPTWFGDLTGTEAGRVRVLRTLYRLADAGLVIVVKSEGGRLERLRLSPEGREAVASLRNVDTAATIAPYGL